MNNRVLADCQYYFVVLATIIENLTRTPVYIIMLYYFQNKLMIDSLTVVLYMDAVWLSGEVERWRLKQFKGVRALDREGRARQ